MFGLKFSPDAWVGIPTLRRGKKKILIFVLGVVLITGFFNFGQIFHARAQTTQEALGLQQIESVTTLGKADIRVTIAKIIRVILGFLGVVTLGVMLYGGFVYMTAGGNEQRIATAKKIMIDGVIGLVIILSSFAITQFVLNKLSQATGFGQVALSANCSDPVYAAANPAICTSGGFNPCDNLDDQFVVRSITPNVPAGSIGMNNFAVRVIFSQGVDLTGITAADVFNISRGGSNVNSEFNFSVLDAENKVVEAASIAPTSVSGNYTVTVLSTLTSVGGLDLETSNTCGSFPNSASFSVTTNGVVENQAPTASPITYSGLTYGGVAALPRGRTYRIGSAITDDSGVGYARLTVQRMDVNNSPIGGPVVFYDGPRITRGSEATAANPYNFSYNFLVSSNTPLYNEAPNSYFRVTLTVTDIDNNIITVTSDFIVVESSCVFGTGQGTDPGCRGNNSCTADWQCLSGVCDEISGQCLNIPLITDVNPWSQAGGSWVTIIGNSFGPNDGSVQFGRDTDADGNPDVWAPAPLASCGGNDVWNDNYIIVEVPADVALPNNSLSSIRVEHQAYNSATNPDFYDESADNRGPLAGPNNGWFTKDNSLSSPGLCAINPSQGAPGVTTVTLFGQKLGTGGAGSLVAFGGLAAAVAGPWTDSQISGATVPANMTLGTVGVVATVGSKQSNGLPFRIVPESQLSAPVIESITPEDTTAGSYITISGQRFGDNPGAVYLAPNTSTDCSVPNACIPLNISLPAACGDTWNSEQIVAQVSPVSIGQKVVVVSNEFGLLSIPGDADRLNIIAGAPMPSICAISPAEGMAPLENGIAGINITGINFSNSPNVKFFGPDTVISTNGGWLALFPGAPIVSNGLETITTKIPVDYGGYSVPSNPLISSSGFSMRSGPIKVRVATGEESNNVKYTVDDCRGIAESRWPDSMRCCTEGPSAGNFIHNSFSCPGETRTGGYVWRFTTGRIANLPRVLEECGSLISPTPWKEQGNGGNICLNAQVSVDFSTDMDPLTFANNVLMFTCGTGNDPDCSSAVDTTVALPAQSVASRLVVRSSGVPVNLLPDTWYRVVLLNGIKSIETIDVLGVPTIFRRPLLRTRPCDVDMGTTNKDDTAYCFDFKTGPAGSKCVLTGAGVKPSEYAVNTLGPIKKSNKVDDLIYEVWGRGDQACSMISVDGLPWVWGSYDMPAITPNQSATVANVSGYTHLATAMAMQEPAMTGNTNVSLQASVNISGQNIIGSSDLFISLSSARVTEYWPSCGAACVNAVIGAKFSRMMDPSSYAGNIELYQCADENACIMAIANNSVAGLTGPLPMDILPAYINNRFEVRLAPVANLTPDTSYLVYFTNGIYSVGQVGANNNILRRGSSLQSKMWQFKTKPDSGVCIADKVVTLPDPFTAYTVGEKTRYVATPYTNPDQCNPNGQALNAWDFGWNWSSADANVATVSNFATAGQLKSTCNYGCLPKGAQVKRKGVLKSVFDAEDDANNPLTGAPYSVGFANNNRYYSTTASFRAMFSAGYIPVDTAKSYKISGLFRSAGANPSLFYLGLAFLDKNYNPITWQEMNRQGNDGVITAVSNSAITVQNTLSDWTNPPGEAFQRSLGFYYDGDNTHVPDYVFYNYTSYFSPLPSQGAYSSATGSTIALNVPLPATVLNNIIPDTTVVKNHLYGGNTSYYNYMAAAGETAPVSFTKYSGGPITGEFFTEPGSPGGWFFPPETAFIQPLILVNYSALPAELQFDDVIFEEVGGVCIPGDDCSGNVTDLWLCGNGKVDPGEDCDIGTIGEVVGVSCSLNCLRPGNTNASCGNNILETNLGEECDKGSYIISTFTDSGTFTPPDTGIVEYLVVGGGGGGASGGGGAGGFRTGTMAVTAQNYTITVGAGGAGKSSVTAGRATNGGDSAFGNIISIGGGGGAPIGDTGIFSGASGGSGGGGGAFGSVPMTTGGAGTIGQGNYGGGSGGFNLSPDPAGGGGGAGAAGSNATGNSIGGNGGVGRISTISGFPTTYAGGGGGGVHIDIGVTYGTGGAGGGGNAAAGAGVSGAANTGGGGGGTNSSGIGGNGGSGIVIIKYLGDPGTKIGCAANCTREGSTIDPAQASGGQSLCGSGQVTVGEDCEPGVNGEISGVTCASNCLHIGTRTAQSWCDANAASQSVPECRLAVSVCGNNIIEKGEECEIIGGAVRVYNSSGASVLTNAPYSSCSSSCLLRDICGTDVPNSGSANFRCDPNTEGCNPDCTLHGSSVDEYIVSSLCGDGVVGIGEYGACEYTPAEIATFGIPGQNPIQAVTAIGAGTLDPNTQSQSTQIISKIASIRAKGATPQRNLTSAEQRTDNSDYALQCGFTEFATSVSPFNNCPSSSSGLTQGVGNNSCCYPRPQRTDEYPLDGAGISGGPAGAVCRNTMISVTFNGDIDAATLLNNLVLAKGYTAPGVSCASPDKDITNALKATLALNDFNNYLENNKGIWQNIWDSVKKMFALVIGKVKASIVSDSALNIGTWCETDLAGVPEAVKIEDINGRVVETVVNVYLADLLEATSTYAIFMRGGRTGIKDVKGVGINSPNPIIAPNQPHLDDSFVFRTGPDICRISNLIINNKPSVFTVPQTSQPVLASVQSIDGRSINPIPNVYDWAWSWGPLNNPIFSIANVATADNTVSSTNLEGKRVGRVNATVIFDSTSQGNQLGQIFTENIDLTSVFCENPWPQVLPLTIYPYEDGLGNNDGALNGVFDGSAIPTVSGSYFNFRLGYCADAGRQADKSDDLPYLRPFVFTTNFPDPDTLKKFLFFNEINNDAIGIQVFKNPRRDSTTDWFRKRLGEPTGFKAVSIDGYDALTDGNNYYINALNIVGVNAYNNIYLISINKDAEVDTKKVFDKIIGSLEFNINFSDNQFCAADPTLVCTTDYDCADKNGTPLAGGTAMCDADKTKMRRDWNRVLTLSDAQEKLRNYGAPTTTPKLTSGTYIPGETRSVWPSWGNLGAQVGGLGSDPLNTWTSCSYCSNDVTPPLTVCANDEDCGVGNTCITVDSQTCWDDINNRFICPRMGNVIGYKLQGNNDYTLYSPLEYFGANNISGFLDTTNSHFVASDALCAGGAGTVVSPTSGVCGNNILNTGEACDPPGQAVVTNTVCSVAPGADNGVETRFCSATCTLGTSFCQRTFVCGNSKKEPTETCDEGVLNGAYGHCSATCSGFSDQFCGNSVVDKHCSNSITTPCQVNSTCTALIPSDPYATCVPSEVCDLGSAVNGTYESGCAVDCQSRGPRCGDGVLQSANSEKCDDGNIVSGDGCRNNCTIESIIIPPAGTTVPAGCGDGQVNNGEACDNGNSPLTGNGIACTPKYGEYCNYCSFDCGEILYIEPIGFCGNQRIDVKDTNLFGIQTYEACEYIPQECNTNGCFGPYIMHGANQDLTLVDYCKSLNNWNPPQGNQPGMYTTQVGGYKCKNSCATYQTSCSTCGNADVSSGGVRPRLSVINPMSGVDEGGRLWFETLFVKFYMKQVDNVHSLSSRPISYAANMVFESPKRIYGSETDNNNAYKNVGILTDPICNGAYYACFNQNGSTGNCLETSLTAAPSSSMYLWPYYVNSETSYVDNDYIISPNPPLGSVRIVVKWKDKDMALLSNGGFGLGILTADNTVTYFSTSTVCDTIQQNTNNYWIPDAGCSLNWPTAAINRQGVFIHNKFNAVQSPKTFVQSMTVNLYDAIAPVNGSFIQGAPFVIFAEARSSNGAGIPMNNLLNSEAELLVFEHHEPEGMVNSAENVFLPDYAFKLKYAQRSSNPSARYWHILNIKRNDDSVSTSTGTYYKYAIEPAQKVRTDTASLVSGAINPNIVEGILLPPPIVGVYIMPTVPVCGNGILEPPEVCDSGVNNGNRLQCNETCTGIIPTNEM